MSSCPITCSRSHRYGDCSVFLILYPPIPSEKRLIRIPKSFPSFYPSTIKQLFQICQKDESHQLSCGIAKGAKRFCITFCFSRGGLPPSRHVCVYFFPLCSCGQGTRENHQRHEELSPRRAVYYLLSFISSIIRERIENPNSSHLLVLFRF